jgi:hypothetical protein
LFSGVFMAKKCVEEAKNEELKRLPSASECRRIFQKRLAKSIEAIAEGFVKAAEKGSCPHVKLANELLVSAIEDQASRRKGPAERMTDEWLRRESEREPKRLRGAGGRFLKGTVLE